MGISCSPIFPSESVVYKIIPSVEKSNVWTDLAVRTSSWSSDDNRLVEFFRVHMLLTPLRLVLVLQYLTNLSFTVLSSLQFIQPLKHRVIRILNTNRHSVGITKYSETYRKIVNDSEI